MKKISAICLLFIAFLGGGCTNDFEQINEDPNRIAEISPATLLNPIIYGLTSHGANRSDAITFNLMQVSVPFPSVSGGLHRYDVSLGIGNSSWDNYYKWLQNIKEMKTAAEIREDANYTAIGLTLNAFAYANLTDLFGPVPMKEAVSAEEGILTPGFDTQEEIYTTILADLEKANSMYDTELPMVYEADILFGNDIERWRKFTNSLHMRLLLRISGRAETNAFEKLSAMVQNPSKYPVFENTEESAILQVTGVTPNVSPWGRPQDFRLSTKMSTFFLDNLNQWNDPRRPIIATKANIEEQVIGYKGIPSAYAGNESQFEYNASTFNIKQVENPMKIYVLPYAEVAFIKAELAQRGYISNGQEYYESGVRAAMEQLGAELPADYFDNQLTAYDASLDQLMLQKYYALYFVDYQQWFEYRRTGMPELPTTEAMFNDAKMPSRLYYPSDLAIGNAPGYKQALEMLGGQDNVNVKVWWDTID